MSDRKIYNERYFLRLLEISPFEQRPRGGWRFGTKIISDTVVDRLLAAGRAEIVGAQVKLKKRSNEALLRGRRPIPTAGRNPPETLLPGPRQRPETIGP
jgi:hypothetical protein